MPLKNVKEHIWNEEDMKYAVEAVRTKKMGYLKAAKLYKVPRATLFRYCKSDKNINDIKKNTLGRNPILPQELEAKLVDYILNMEKNFFGLTRRDLRTLAFQLARRNNLPNNFSLLQESAGKKWLKGFLKRHGHKISIRKPTGTSVVRASGFNRQSVSEFFDLLEKVMDEKKFSPKQIFNVDECGICIVQSKCPQILALKGKRQIGALTSTERGSLITVSMCMSADGVFVPPMVIFPRKNCNEQLKKGAPPGTLFKFHPSGWIQMDLFTAWFDHFIEYIRPSETNPVLLILDGHNTHTRNLDVLLKAKENFVTILSLPPHTSHKMQPLDKTVMGALKTFYNEEIRIFLRNNQRPVSHFDVCELFGKAYLKIQSAERAVKGFATTGICPTRRNIFNDDDFLTVEHQDQICNVPSQAPVIITPQAENGNGNARELLTVSPEDITPIPNLKRKVGTRGRKPGRAKIITSTPNKEELEQSVKVKEVKAATKNKDSVKKRVFSENPGCSSAQEHSQTANKILKKAKHRKKNVSSSSSESAASSIPDQNSSDDEEILLEQRTKPDQDVHCLFCDEMFSDNNQGEIWVMCLMCNCWAHEDCAGAEKEQYICDFCR